MPDTPAHHLFDVEVTAWVEQNSSIHLKAVTASGDPVELTWDAARKLGKLLILLADQGEQAEGKQAT
jgi:hypothetical protein